MTTPRIDKRRICASCLARIRFHEPMKHGSWTKITMPPLSFFQLRAAAREFDDITANADEVVTVLDFIEWLAPSVEGSSRFLGHDIPDMAGVAVEEYGHKTGTARTRHGQPDPLPFLDRRTA